MGLKAQGLGMMVSPRLCTRRFVFLDTGVGCSFGDLHGVELCSFEDGRTCSSNLLSIGGGGGDWGCWGFSSTLWSRTSWRRHLFIHPNDTQPRW